MLKVAPSRRVLGLLFLAGFVILADQAIDLAATVLLQPADTSTANWRVAVFGMAASRASLFLIADVLMLVAAVGLEHRRMLRLMSVTHAALAVILVIGLVLFARDTVEVQQTVGSAGRSHFLASIGRTMAVTMAGIGFLGWAAMLGWTASRRSGPKGESEPESRLLPTARDTRRLP